MEEFEVDELSAPQSLLPPPPHPAAKSNTEIIQKDTNGGRTADCVKRKTEKGMLGENRTGSG